MMDDFIFRDVDTASLGAFAAFGEQMILGTKIKRGTYALPGGGQVTAGPDSYGEIRRNVTLYPLDGDADDAWRRRILAHLTAGPGRLTVKDSPQTYRWARFDDSFVLNLKKWPGGCLDGKVIFAGLAHSSRLTSRTFPAASGQTAAARVMYETALPSPLILTIRGTGGTVTAARIVTPTGETMLDGLALGAGQVLTIDSGDPLQERRADVTIGDAPGWNHVKRWGRLMAGSGETVMVTLTGGSADVTVQMRGRWPE